ncbi:MAG: tetratricopeptide repeat protein [Gammaproteobacteria bacterium]
MTAVFRKYLSVTASLMLLSACATQPSAPDAPAAPAPEAVAAVPLTAAGHGVASDVLYQLLVAEVAGHRNQLDLATANYLAVARQTRDPAVIERAIRVAIYARDDAIAAEIAELWLDVSPDNMDAHQVLAATAIRAGDIDTAVSHLETVLTGADGDINQKFWLIANLLSREDEKQTVIAVMDRLVTDYRDNPEVLFAYSHLALRLNDLDRAETLLEDILALAPDNSNAVMSYLSVLQRQDKLPKALTWLQSNLERFNDDFNLRLLYARLLTDARRFDEARAEFEWLDAQAPENPDVLYALGLLALQSNQLDNAEDYFSRLQEIGVRGEQANYYLGRIAEERAELGAAADFYTSVTDGENYFDAQVRLGMLLARQGRIDAAREHLQGINAENDQQETLLIQAEAELLVEQERYADAMSVYDAALIDNQNIDLLYARAMLAEKMDRLEILERDLGKILEQDPDHVQALNAYGYTLADRNVRLDEAVEYIKRALELRPNDFYILDSMGWALYRMGRFDEAIDYLRQALAINNDPEVAAHLGEVLWVKGERDAARRIWESALDATPDDERLLRVMQRLDP